MRTISRIVVSLLCLTLAACGNAPSSAPGSPSGASVAPTGPSASYSLDPAADDFTAPAHPLDLTVTADPGRAATAHITTAGGSLMATGADGTTFTLDIPPDSLAEDTDITMTPVATIGGWDVAPGNVAAVTLAPDGLSFASPARLTITPSAPIGDVQVAPFQFYAQGKDANLVLADHGAPGIAIPVEHFSGHGVAWDVSIPFWLAWARYRQTQAEDRLHNLLAEELGRISAQQKAGQVPDKTLENVVDGLIGQWERDILNRRLLLVSKSCSDAQFAVNGFLEFARQMALLGIDRHIDPPPRLANLARYVCAEEATKLCFQNGDIERLRWILLADARTLQILGTTTGGDTAAYIEACDRFDLQIQEHSETSTLGPGQEIKYQADLTLTIPLRYTGDPGDGTGGLIGDTVGEAKAVFKSGSGIYSGPGFACTVKIKGGPADVPFQAKLVRVDYINTGPARDSIRLKDIQLKWTPGHLTGDLTLVCPGTSTPDGTQNLPFEFLRFKNQNKYAVDIVDWTAEDHPLMASKTFTREADLGDGGTGGAAKVTASETIKLKLVHTPGPMPPRPDIPVP